jgi:hypothetical protein
MFERPESGIGQIEFSRRQFGMFPALGKRVSLLALLSVLSWMGGVASLQAMEDFDSEESRLTVVRAAPNKARHRLYPGGRDEEELQVQASLPMPSRNPDGLTQSVTDSAASGSVDRD